MRAASHPNGAAELLVDARIPDDDPAWLAAMNAPFDLVRLRDDDAVTVRLRVPPYGARLTLDRMDGILTV